MPSKDLLENFMERTEESLKAIQKDVRDLMKFRWMVMGGAAVASFLFTILFEIAKAMAVGK